MSHDHGADLPAHRISSDQREAAIARLSDAFARDLLTIEEFERRADDVYRAETTTALAVLTQDLPEPTADAETGTAVIPHERVGARVSAFLSSVERGGPLEIPRELRIRARLGHVLLDLRDARLQPGVTEIDVRALMGNVEILLPDSVAVEHGGRAILGNFSTRGGRGSTGEGGEGSVARTVRIAGRAILSNVECRSE